MSLMLMMSHRSLQTRHSSIEQFFFFLILDMLPGKLEISIVTKDMGEKLATKSHLNLDLLMNFAFVIVIFWCTNIFCNLLNAFLLCYTFDSVGPFFYVCGLAFYKIIYSYSSQLNGLHGNNEQNFFLFPFFCCSIHLQFILSLTHDFSSHSQSHPAKQYLSSLSCFSYILAVHSGKLINKRCARMCSVSLLFEEEKLFHIFRLLFISELIPA